MLIEWMKWIWLNTFKKRVSNISQHTCGFVDLNLKNGFGRNVSPLSLYKSLDDDNIERYLKKL